MGSADPHIEIKTGALAPVLHLSWQQVPKYREHDALHDRRSDQSSSDEVERIVAQPWEMVRTVPRPASYLADYIQDRTRIACDNLSH
jgi:hypothetical protein